MLFFMYILHSVSLFYLVFIEALSHTRGILGLPLKAYCSILMLTLYKAEKEKSLMQSPHAVCVKLTILSSPAPVRLLSWSHLTITRGFENEFRMLAVCGGGGGGFNLFA